MITVRVIREMPGLEIGELLPVKNGGFVDKCLYLNYKYLINKGWVEVVEEEKSLAEKMGFGEYEDEKIFWNLRANIAKEHFKEIINKFVEENWYTYEEKSFLFTRIVEAIEKG